MTKEEFKAKAKEIIENEQFGPYGALFGGYEDFDEIKLAQIDNYEDVHGSMPIMEFLDELYEQIKGDLK